MSRFFHLKVLLVFLASTANVHSAKHDIKVPHLSGIFLALSDTNLNNTLQQWTKELTAMKDVGIEFFCVRAVMRSVHEDTPSCPLGEFESFYPTRMSRNSSCVKQAITLEADPIGTILNAAKTLGLGVHLGMSFRSNSSYPNFNSTQFYREYAYFQWTIAEELWSLYKDSYGATLQGFYTGIEESNVASEFLQTKDLQGHYLEPLARDIKTLSSELLVWASPYYVGNLTRHNKEDIMTPQFYADWWEQIFWWSPDLDLIAPQDSMGAQGNSFENVSSYLSQIANRSRQAGRKVWSNVELFEVWPSNCSWTPTHSCRGRHPAPIERITAQMHNEAPLVDLLIAWEWESCLSPYGSNDSAALYTDYKQYIEGGTTP
eukprot:m.137841 g.137841  ORF g.137841 m.137841 type:complete len:374 (-) comp14765_c0_seq1:10-1131(-)